MSHTCFSRLLFIYANFEDILYKYMLSVARFVYKYLKEIKKLLKETKKNLTRRPSLYRK